MKTRILVKEYNSGKKEFIPQYSDHTLLQKFVILTLGFYKPFFVSFKMYQGEYRTEIVFHNCEMAQKFIDEYIIKINKRKETEYLQKIKKSHVIKYP